MPSSHQHALRFACLWDKASHQRVRGVEAPWNFLGRKPKEEEENMGPRPSTSRGTLCGMLMSSQAM